MRVLASAGVESLTPKQNGQCGNELLAGIRFAGTDCAACADLSVVQIVICKSTGAAFASNGHNALHAMPKMANQAMKRRLMRRSL
jgi:hypothetical protein